MATQEIQEALLHAGVAAMAPYVRRMLAAGITFGRLEARLRELFVMLAAHEITSSGPPTDSRISIVTGINRKEVRRLRSRDDQAAPRTFSRSLVASLVSRWMTDRRTTDAAGRPRPLPYDARRGPSFVRLARETTVDLKPRALLDVLTGTGAALLREGNVVVLTRGAYVPKRGRPEALAMLVDDPPELIETMLHNVLGEGESAHLQQKLAYDNLGSDGLARLRTALRREADRFLARANSVLVRHDRDRTARAPQGARTYAGIGVYYFERPRPEPRRPSPLRSTPKAIRKRRRTP